MTDDNGTRVELTQLACAVADAYVSEVMPHVWCGALDEFPLLRAALDRLDAATRGSALRKVRP